MAPGTPSEFQCTPKSTLFILIWHCCRSWPVTRQRFKEQMAMTYLKVLFRRSLGEAKENNRKHQQGARVIRSSYLPTTSLEWTSRLHWPAQRLGRSSSNDWQHDYRSGMTQNEVALAYVKVVTNHLCMKGLSKTGSNRNTYWRQRAVACFDFRTFTPNVDYMKIQTEVNQYLTDQ